MTASASDAATATATDIDAFRCAFLTASTWARATASDIELAFALAQWPRQTLEEAISQMLERRALDRRGLLRRQAREAREAVEAEEAAARANS